MAYFEFPNTRTYNSDLGWLIWAMKKLIGDWENFSNTNSIKFADPILWNISSNYEPSTIVIDDDGNGYISRTAVPAGVPLSNETYWTEIFSFGDITNTIRENIAVNEEESPTATQAITKDSLLWWNNDLYIALYDFPAGTAFIEGTNVARITVDERIRDLANKTVPYPIYYPSQELAVFGGSIGAGEVIETSGDIHYYDPDTNTMSIIHN